jgi:hypothetical protein
MGDLSGVKVGDVVLLLERYGTSSGRAVTVTKAGRKLLTIGEGYAAETYRIESGLRNTADPRSLIRTLAQHAEILERAELLGALRDMGITFDRFGASAEVATAKLRRFLALWAAASDDGGGS